MIDTSALNPQGIITCFAIAAGIAALVGYWTAPEHKERGTLHQTDNSASKPSDGGGGSTTSGSTSTDQEDHQ